MDKKPREVDGTYAPSQRVVQGNGKRARTQASVNSEEHPCRFTMEQVLQQGRELQVAAVMLTTTLTDKCLDHDKDASCLQLVRHLKSKWMRSINAIHLSEAAVLFILRHTKPYFVTDEDGDDDDRLDASLDEYFRFRGVVLWCLYETANFYVPSFKELDKLVDAAMPIDMERLYGKGSKELSSMEVAWLPNYVGSPSQNKIKKYLHSHRVFKSAVRLLAHIEWVRMPPTLFVKIVEPMKLIPKAQLLDIFRFHYVKRVVSMPLKLKWAYYDTLYSERKGGLVIQKEFVNSHMDESGCAVCLLENRAGDDTCIWRFIVHGVDSSLCELGFACSDVVEDPCETWHLECDCVGAFQDSGTMWVRVVELDTRKVHFDGHGGNEGDRAFRSIKSAEVKTVEFRYHRSSGSCALKLDEEDLGTVWTGLPTTRVLPALCVGYNPRAGSRKPCVQLEIVSGFNVF